MKQQEKSLSLKNLTKSTVWNIQENDVFRLWAQAERDADLKDNENHYLDIIKSASAAVGRDLPYVITPRRAGDIAACYADATKAKEELGWEAQYDVKRMCEDSWRWQSKHPNGFEE